MISIIIITLNEEKYVGKLLDCLKKQTYQDFEVIVIDGKSEDNTKREVEKYKKNMPRLKFYTAKKRGVSFSRNEGARKAKGEYIFFMDADNELDDNFLERCLYYLKKRNLDAAGVYIKTRSKNVLDNFYIGFSNVWAVLTQGIWARGVGACLIAKKYAHQGIKGFDEKIKVMEDEDYANRMQKKFRYGIIPVSFYYSNRRWAKEGRINYAINGFMMEFHRLFIGEIKSGRFKYRFGHYEKK